MVLLPVAVSGAVVVALATGNRHALGAAAGLVAILVIAVRHAVVLVRNLVLSERDDRVNRAEAVTNAVAERLVPILASTTATALVMVPFAVLGDTAGNEITYPMSLVILGGLVTTLLLVLAVIPAAYERIARAPQPLPEPSSEVKEKEPIWGEPAKAS